MIGVHTKDISYPYQSKCLLHIRDEKTEAERKKQPKTVLDLTWSHVLCGELALESWPPVSGPCTLSSKPHRSAKDNAHRNSTTVSLMAPFPQLQRVLPEFCSFSQGSPDVKAMDF